MPKLLIIDERNFDKELIDKENIVIYWYKSILSDSKKRFNILDIVEDDADQLKSLYLDWIDKMSKLKINNLPLYKSLNLRNLYSFWWQTFLVEKSNYENSTHIVDAIKLLALQNWLKKNPKNINQIEIHSSNKKLIKCLDLFAKDKKIIFNFKKYKKKSKKLKLKTLFKKLIPLRLRSIFWLLVKIKYSILIFNKGLEDFKNNESDVLFVDYLVNFDQEKFKNGIFQSNYWGPIIDVLKKNKIKSTWIHLPVDNGSDKRFFKNSIQISRKLKQFNMNSNNFQNHVSIDSFLNFNVLKKQYLIGSK